MAPDGSQPMGNQANETPRVGAPSAQAVIVLDRAGCLQDATSAAVALLGYSVDELRTLSAHDLLMPEPAQTQADPAQIWQPGQRTTVTLRHQDGHPIPAQLTVSQVELAGQLWRICVLTEPESPSPDRTEAIRNSSQDSTGSNQAAEREKNVRQHLELALHAAQLGIWTYDIESDFLEWDERMYEIYGVDPGDRVLGMDIWRDFLHPEERASKREMFETLFSGSSVFTQGRIVRPDGEVRHIDVAATPIHDENGIPIKLIGVNRDVTTERKAETVLRRSESLYRSIINALSEGLLVQDQADNIVMSNPEAAKILGLTMEQMRAKDAYDPRWQARREDGSLLDPEDYPWVIAMRTGKPVSEVIMRIATGDRGNAVISVNTQPILNDAEEVTGTVTTFSDITELKTSEDLFRAFFTENVSPVYWVEMRHPVPIDLPADEQVDAIFREAYIKDVSDTIAQMYGFANREAVIGKPLAAVYGDDVFDHDSATHRSYLAWVRDSYRSATSESPELTQTGDVLWVVSNTMGVIENGHLIRIWGSQIDITERKQAEEKLISLSKAIEQSPVSVVITDAKGTIQYVNPKFCQVTGYSLDEAIGQNPRILKSGSQSSDYYKRMWDALKAGEEWQGEFHNKKKNGELYWELASIAPVRDDRGRISHYVAVKEDITERKRMEEEINRQERLASVGQLAAGIAHDFNNILAAITLYTQMIGRTDPISPKDRERLDVITQQAWHASRLVQQILDFSRKGILRRQPLDLLPLFREQVQLLARTLPENIVLALHHNGDEFTVNADATRMQQILTNLAVNARDAMPHGGRIQIDVGQVTVGSEDVSPFPGVGPGDWVQLIISDTGVGIPTHILPQIFDPFFTTKGPGEGSGLGLAQVHGIVGQHGGHINVESEAGQGTTFIIHLPALLQERAAASQQSKGGELPTGAGELILVVEDELILRNAIVATLETWNYRTVEADHGESALALLAKHGTEIALVISDVVMPVMGGVALMHALEEENLAVPVILISGHPMEKENGNLPNRRPAAWLTKPLDLDTLSKAILTALRG